MVPIPSEQDLRDIRFELNLSTDVQHNATALGPLSLYLSLSLSLHLHTRPSSSLEAGGGDGSICFRRATLAHAGRHANGHSAAFSVSVQRNNGCSGGDAQVTAAESVVAAAAAVVSCLQLLITNIDSQRQDNANHPQR